MNIKLRGFIWKWNVSNCTTFKGGFCYHFKDDEGEMKFSGGWKLSECQPRTNFVALRALSIFLSFCNSRT